MRKRDLGVERGDPLTLLHMVLPNISLPPPLTRGRPITMIILGMIMEGWQPPLFQELAKPSHQSILQFEMTGLTAFAREGTHLVLIHMGWISRNPSHSVWGMVAGAMMVPTLIPLLSLGVVKKGRHASFIPERWRDKFLLSIGCIMVPSWINVWKASSPEKKESHSKICTNPLVWVTQMMNRSHHMELGVHSKSILSQGMWTQIKFALLLLKCKPILNKPARWGLLSRETCHDFSSKNSICPAKKISMISRSHSQNLHGRRELTVTRIKKRRTDLKPNSISFSLHIAALSLPYYQCTMRWAVLREAYHRVNRGLFRQILGLEGLLWGLNVFRTLTRNTLRQTKHSSKY